ncbi:MAG: hypothetical protein AB1806_09425 [Acidobacteriota bacterium]
MNRARCPYGFYAEFRTGPSSDARPTSYPGTGDLRDELGVTLRALTASGRTLLMRRTMLIWSAASPIGWR